MGQALFAGLLVVTACRMQQPPITAPQRGVAIEEAPVFTPMTVRPEIKNRREIVQAMMRAYPPILRDAGVGGLALVWFFIDETGRTVDTRLSRSSGRAALDAAAIAVSRIYEFTPAFNKEQPVKVWVQIPITFAVR